jgi:hypothetical protein
MLASEKNFIPFDPREVEIIPALRFASGRGYRAAHRECDDAHKNFRNIRNETLWRELEQKRLAQSQHGR